MGRQVITTTLKYFVILIALFGSISALGQDFPPQSNRLVTDYTNTLNAAQLQQLESKLVAFDDSTSTQIAVVMMQSTGQYDIADYGVRLAQRWGIGGAEHNNGILLLVALGDRAVTIQTGYGVEGAVPDVIAYRIIENEIKPAFRQGDYFSGIDRATDALISYTKGEYTAPPKAGAKGVGFGGLIMLFVVVAVIIAIASRGRGGGGGGRVMDSRGASDLLWWTILSGMGRGGRG